MKMLVINPGSTSTKISVYEDETSLFEENIFHDAPELLKFSNVNKQLPFRRPSYWICSKNTASPLPTSMCSSAAAAAPTRRNPA